MLLSGPAGGVTGAVWVAEQSGYTDLLTFDMGGTSTDVALVQGLTPRIGRETKVGDLTVRASVGRRAHGRRGRRLDRARPAADQGAAGRAAVRGRRARPGRVRQGRHRADRHRRQRRARLPARPSLAGGEITLDVEAARTAVQTIADAMGLASPRPPRPASSTSSTRTCSAALRLVSVQQGFDPRDFALVAFGGAGPLHANALGQADRGLAGDRAAVAGRAVRARRRDDLGRATSRPARCCAGSRDLTGDELRDHPRRAGRRGRRHGWSSRASRRSRADDDATRSTSATTGRASRSRSTVAPTSSRTRRGRAAGAGASTPSTSGCSPSCSPPTTSWSTPGPRSPARGRRWRRSTLAPATGPRRAASTTHPIYVDGGIVDAERLRPRRSCGPATWSPVRRSSPRWTRPRWCCPATPRPSHRVRQPADPPRREGGLSMARIVETATGAGRERRRRPGHPRPDRERAAQRPLRDGRGAVPHRAVARHPRAARRVPADRRPATARWWSASSACRSPTSWTASTAPSRRATSCSPPTRTRAAPRSATPTTGWWCCRSSSRAGWSAGRRCSGTCPTSAARRRARCRPTRAPSTRRAWSSRPSSCTATGSSTRTRCGSSSTRCGCRTGTAPTSTGWSPPAARRRAGCRRCARGSAPGPTCPRSTPCCSATTTP